MAWLQYFITGLTLGSTYWLTGLGFTLIWSSTGIINFAQGEFMMLGGMLAVFGIKFIGLSLLASIIFAVLTTAIIGAIVELLVIRPMQHRPTIHLIIATLGAAIVIRGVVMLFLGKDTHALEPFTHHAPLKIFGAALVPQSLWVLVTTTGVVAALRFFFASTLEGKAMRACACDPKAAALVGVAVPHMVLISFVLSAFIGAFGGVLLASITMTSYDVGIMLGLKGFAACIVGGLGNPFGAVAGGLLLGVLESYAARYISSAYKDAVALVALLVVLFLRPSGIFARKDVQRV
jgi:branched-chain amino acid transport system permease protein